MRKRTSKKQFLKFVRKVQLDGTLLQDQYIVSKLSKRWLQLDNREKIAYLKKGSGEHTIIFVHGNMSSSVHYSPLFKRLPSDFTAYAPDLRGFGDSSYYTPIQTLRDFADDLYQFITKLGLRDFTLVGWSTGGGVCLSFDAQYPGLCNNIVLIDSIASNGYAIYHHDASGRPIPGKIYKSKKEMMCDPQEVLLVYHIMIQNYLFMDALWQKEIYVVNTPSVRDNYVYLTESLKQRNMIDVEWALANFNMTSQPNPYVDGDSSIDKVTVPVLCIRGNEDIVITKEMFNLTVDSIGENAKTVIFPQCGHSPFVDCPDLLAENVFNFSLKN